MGYQRSLQTMAVVLGSIAALLLVSAATVWTPPATMQPAQMSAQLRTTSLLARVQERGFIRCGVEGGLAGFSLIQGQPAFEENGRVFYREATGFDTDFCRVVAVAVFGMHDERVYFTPVGADQRFELVRTEQIDILIRNTTWTVSRDIALGIDFGPIIYHDGQKFLAPVQSGIQRLADLEGQTICVLPNTTTLENMKAVLDEMGLTYEVVTQRRPNEDFRDTGDVIEAYLRQKCMVMTSDESQLLARYAELMNPTEHMLFPEQAISYEPLAPVVKENDSVWRNIVSYAIFATIYGEQLGISSANIRAYDENSQFLDKQFLGIRNDNVEQLIGPSLGIDQNFTLHIIEQLGNYSEIFERNLGDIIPERGPNQIWGADPLGKLFSPPWHSAIYPTLDDEN